ncbi:pyruvate, water dikinase regulatory protein [Alicyclobacillus dauci]|uniref:Putative pyruvate, phosphate dikinase regulatory protein n=1 Tax=Alicyclobacillus dauci TaxID=1475485 RepID=A0ABY6Z5S2_9BACL|nr:pyruvate, water dikinase regulatory protein [Alicyclobacillus dauci]WAH38221.1 kinase/pyrophosphorylase [Alicyclobacillus dauci]
MGTRVPTVYIVSDSIGETAEFVARAAASQFESGHFTIRKYTGVKDTEVLERVVSSAAADGGFIAFTLVLESLRTKLVSLAKEQGVAVVDIMGPMLLAFEGMLKEAPAGRPGVIHQLDADYYRRVEAVEFAVKYDDGRDPRGLERADVILVGVSRTSKTPLSMYLAHKQLRSANIPLVPEVTPPAALFAQRGKRKIIGLSIHPDKLTAVRQARLQTLGLASQASYASEERILQELRFADDVMVKLGCPVIDVTDRAVEETASLILDYLASGEDHR